MRTKKEIEGKLPRNWKEGSTYRHTDGVIIELLFDVRKLLARIACERVVETQDIKDVAIE
jgi:hypothetical protein